jgi:hypothetical protein
MVGSGSLDWPLDSLERVALQRGLLDELVAGKEDIANFCSRFMYAGNRLDDCVVKFTDQLFRPFYRDFRRALERGVSRSSASPGPSARPPVGLGGRSQKMRKDIETSAAWYKHPGVQAAIAGSVVAGIFALVTSLLTRESRPPAPQGPIQNQSIVVAPQQIVVVPGVDTLAPAAGSEKSSLERPARRLAEIPRSSDEAQPGTPQHEIHSDTGDLVSRISYRPISPEIRAGVTQQLQTVRELYATRSFKVSIVLQSGSRSRQQLANELASVFEAAGFPAQVTSALMIPSNPPRPFDDVSINPGPSDVDVARAVASALAPVFARTIPVRETPDRPSGVLTISLIGNPFFSTDGVVSFQ